MSRDTKQRRLEQKSKVNKNKYTYLRHAVFLRQNRSFFNELEEVREKLWSEYADALED